MAQEESIYMCVVLDAFLIHRYSISITSQEAIFGLMFWLGIPKELGAANLLIIATLVTFNACSFSQCGKDPVISAFYVAVKNKSLVRTGGGPNSELQIWSNYQGLKTRL